jgi:hypothetical protein
MFYLDPQEKLDYFIGDIRLTVTAFVPKANCPRCGNQWEDQDARNIRNYAFRNAINDFWMEAFKNIAGDREISQMRFSFKKALDKVGTKKRRQAAEALAHWLADLTF